MFAWLLFGVASPVGEFGSWLERVGMVQGTVYAGPLPLLRWKGSKRGWRLLPLRDPQIRSALWVWHRILNPKRKE